MASTTLFQSLRRLACFAAIADAGSIKGGAHRLRLSVPVVSSALSELEQELAAKLAVRTTRKLELTQIGQQVYEHAQQMLNSADAALLVATHEQVGEGELRITAPVELGTHWLPNALLPFHQKYPGIELQIDSDDSVVTLRSSEYDVAIQANYRPPGETDMTKLVQPVVNFGTMNLVCVAAKRPRVDWSRNIATMNLPLIEQKGRGDYLTAVEKKTSRKIKLHGECLMRTNNHESALAMVRAGLGCVLVMDASVNQDLANKQLVRVLPGYDFGAVQIELKLRDSLPSPATKAFVQYMKQQFTKKFRAK